MTTTARTTVASGSSRRTLSAILVWLVVSMLSAVGLLAFQPVSGIDTEILSLVMLAPAVGAGATWLVARRGIPRFPAAARFPEFAMSMALSLLAVAVCAVVMSIAHGGIPEIPSRVAGASVLVMVAAQVLGALGEEIGFRGTLLQAFSRWWSWPVAATLNGLLFGLWHIQYYGLPILELLMFVVGTIALTVTMAAVMTGSFWQRMAACTLVHAGANVILAFTVEAEGSLTPFAISMTIAAVVVVPVAIAVRRKS